MKKYICPACGYPELDEPPRSGSGGGSYEICSSCGFEFGYTDDDQNFTYETWRKKWIDEGMIWDKGRNAPPLGWNPKEQLKNIDVEVEKH